MIQFVDEAFITVEAGKGGAGCVGFRREKYIPFGGPDGGDGGDGGSVYLVADLHVNTLSQFRYLRHHRAKNGQGGMGQLRRGKSGEDLLISVPLGTIVYDEDTGERLGDLTTIDQRLCVARGGFHGLGNARYKSSTNRAPRQSSPGTPGEIRKLKLELQVLADVGLCGLPNAGKSTLIRAVSNATPKVADYPFTTLVPELGVVPVSDHRSFVMADIPGLIEGASEGVGLGVQFLKHLQRTRVLVHLVDIATPATEEELINDIHTIETELKEYDEMLSEKERWLVFNKVDLLSSQEVEQRTKAVLKKLKWQKPVFHVSAQLRQGTAQLCGQLMDFLSRATD